MRIVRPLDRNLFYHAALGSLFAVLLFVALLLSGYRDSQVDAEESLVRIRRNLMEMDSARKDLSGKKALLGRVVPAGYGKESNRALMLSSLERAKGRVPGARLTVTGFMEETGELALGFAVEFPVHGYNEVIRNVGVFEDMALPYFSPAGLTIIRAEDTGEVTGRIEGSLRMPAQKVVSAENGKS